MPTIAQNLRGFFSSSFLTLPLILYGWSFFLGLTTGNVGLLILSLGAVTIVPIVTWFSHKIIDWILNLIVYGSIFDTDANNVSRNQKASVNKEVYKSFFATENCKACSILQTGEGCTEKQEYVFPSYWMAEVVFFFFFIISNATAIKDMKEEEGAPADKVQKRKDQASLVLVIAIVLFLLIVAVRYFILGCETITGVAYALTIFGSLAYAWYNVARSCSMRDSDLFGIVQGIVPPNINDPAPMTCIYQG